MNKWEKVKIVLNSHGIVCFPTETVMGLGVFYDDKIAYDKLNIIKERKPGKPYTLMLDNPHHIPLYAEVTPRAQKVINAFMPGPLTIILKAKKDLPPWVSEGTGTVGIRCPNSEATVEMLKHVEKPLLAPSANRAGQPPCKNSKEVKKVFGDDLDLIVKGKATSNISSTVVDLTSPNIKVIREGVITKEQILKVLEEK